MIKWSLYKIKLLEVAVSVWFREKKSLKREAIKSGFVRQHRCSNIHEQDWFISPRTTASHNFPFTVLLLWLSFLINPPPPHPLSHTHTHIHTHHTPLFFCPPFPLFSLCATVLAASVAQPLIRWLLQSAHVISKIGLCMWCTVIAALPFQKAEGPC